MGMAFRVVEWKAAFTHLPTIRPSGFVSKMRRLPTYQQLDHLALSQKWVKGDTFRRYKMGRNMLPSGNQRSCWLEKPANIIHGGLNVKVICI